MKTSQNCKESTEELRSLEMIVDYAMVESASLNLPIVVYLLQIAQAEISSAKKSAVGLKG